MVDFTGRGIPDILAFASFGVLPILIASFYKYSFWDIGDIFQIFF